MANFDFTKWNNISSKDDSLYYENKLKNSFNQNIRKLELSKMDWRDSASSVFREENLYVRAYESAKDWLYPDTSKHKKEQIEEKYLKERLTDRGIGENYTDAIKKKALNKDHLEDVLDEYETKTLQDQFRDKNSVLGGMGWYMLSGISEVAPLIALSPIALPATASAMTATIGSRFVGGALYESLLEAGKQNLGEQDRTWIDSALSIGSAGVFNSVLGKPTGKYASKAIGESAKSTVRESLGISKDEFNSLEKLYKSDKQAGDKKLQEFQERAKGKEKGSNGLITREMVEQSLQGSVERGNMFENVANALRVDMQYLTSKSKSESFSNFSKAFFYDNAFNFTSDNKTYLGVEVNNLKAGLEAIYLKETNEIRKEFSNLGLLENFTGHKDRLFDLMGEARISKEYGLNGVAKGDDASEIQFLTKKLVDDFKFEEDNAFKLATKISDSGNRINKQVYDKLSMYSDRFKNGEIKYNKDFNHIVYDREAIEKLSRVVSKDDIYNYFTTAWIKGQSDELQALIASNKQIENQIKDSMRRWAENLFSSRRVNYINDVQREINLKDEIEKVLKKELDKVSIEGKTASGLMPRMKFDRSYTHQIGKTELKYSDFIEKNYESIIEQYSRDISGRIGLEKYVHTGSLRELDESGNIINTSLKDYNLSDDFAIYNFSKDIESELNLARRNNMITNREYDSEMLRLEHILNVLTGRPTVDNPFGIEHKITDILKNFTNAKLLGQAAWSQPAEMVTTASYIGVTNIMKALPIARKMVTAMRTGKLNNEELDEIMFVTGYGADLLRGIGSMRYDEAFSTKVNRSALLDRVHLFSEQYANATYLVSGMKPITTMLQLSSVLAIQKEFKKFAETGVKSTLIERLQKDLRISDEMTDRISKQFDKYNNKFYHGTDVKFDKIDKTMHENGLVFVSRNKKVAEGYAKQSGKGEPNVHEMYLDIQKTFDGTNPQHIAELKTKLDLSDEEVESFMSGDWKPVEFPRNLKAIKELGYDSAYVMDNGIEKYNNIAIFDIDKAYTKKQNKINYDQWDDIEARDVFTQSLRIITDNLVQHGTLQDAVGIKGATNELITNTVIGKLALSLKTYMIQSYTKQLLRNVNTMDLNKALMLGTQAFVLFMATTAQEYSNYSGTEKLEERLQMDNIMVKTLERMSISTYASMFTKAIRDEVEGNYRIEDSISSAFAPVVILDDLWNVTGGGAINLLSGKEEEVAKDLVNTLPNWNILQNMKNRAKDQIAEYKKEKKGMEEYEPEDEPMTVEDLFKAF